MICSSDSVSPPLFLSLSLLPFTLPPADRAATLTVESGSPAATLVDFFPMMRHIPTWIPVISDFKRKALQAREAVDSMFHQPYECVRQDMVSVLFLISVLSLSR